MQQISLTWARRQRSSPSCEIARIQERTKEKINAEVYWQNIGTDVIHSANVGFNLWSVDHFRRCNWCGYRPYWRGASGGYSNSQELVHRNIPDHDDQRPRSV